MPTLKYERILPETKECIIHDLEEGRLSYGEIASIRLGDSSPKHRQVVARIAKVVA